MKKPAKNKTIELDVSDLDRTTILGQIRYAYRMGYDTIQISFKNIEAPHLRKDERHNVRDIIHQGIIRLLLGVTMHVVDDHHITLHVKEPHTLRDVPQVMKQVIVKIAEMHAELILLIQGHLYAATAVEEKHDSITRLVSHCMRLLNTIASPESATHAHLMASIDKIADLIKYMARDYLTFQRPMTKSSITLMRNMHTCVEQYTAAYLAGTKRSIATFSFQRDEVKRQTRALLKSLDPKEAFFLGQETAILEIMTDMMEPALALHQ